MMGCAATLEGVEVLVFDVFGTVADWRTYIVQQLSEVGKKYYINSVDWTQFANEWRKDFLVHMKIISETGNGPTNIDILHRQLLDNMIDSPGSPWSRLSPLWNHEERQNITHFWHNIKGWPDVPHGLAELKKQFIVATLSNGSMRLLVNMAKYANFPWDVVFSTELFNTYKPDPIVYQSVTKFLDVPPHKCAMVAAHLFDLRAAKSCGYKTVYVRRPAEDQALKDNDSSTVKSRQDGGFEEVDFVVDSIVELADVMKSYLA